MLPRRESFGRLHRRCRWLFLLTAALSGAAWTTTAATAADSGGNAPISGSAAVPLVRTSMNHLGIEAAINGRPVLLALDTGAPLTTMDAAAYKRCVPADATPQAPAKVLTLKTLNNQPATTGWVQDLQAGGMHFGAMPVAVTDLGQIFGKPSPDRRDRAVAGLLGADILTKYGAVIDWSRHVVYFYADPAQREQIGRAAMSNGWTAIPMEFTNGRHFAVPCTLGTGNHHLIVDTGAALTIIDKSIWGAKDPTAGQPRGYMMGITGATAVSPLILKSWSIGTFPMKNSLVAVGNFHGNGLFDEVTPGPGRIVGILGSDWLAFRAGIIDINGMTLYLKAPAR